jgi:hypothetical protein
MFRLFVNSANFGIVRINVISTQEILIFLSSTASTMLIILPN